MHLRRRAACTCTSQPRACRGIQPSPWGDNQRAVANQVAFNVRLTFPDDGEEDGFVAGGAASGAPPTEAARLTFKVPFYAENSCPKASANSPSSTPSER